MALPAADLIAWLGHLGWDTTQESGAPIVAGPYILKEPDQLVTVTATGGPGYVLEAAADACTFQARVRGGQNNQADAERLAYALDALILGASFPAVTSSGQVIVHVHRLGGPPAPLAAGPDDGDRFEFVSSYVAIVSAAVAG